MRLIFNVGLCYTMGKRLVGLVPRGSANTRPGSAFRAGARAAAGLCIAEALITDIIAASDVCVTSSASQHGNVVSSGPTAISLAMAMGVPVAACLGPRLRRSDESPPPVRARATDDPNRLTVPVIHLLEEPELRLQIAAEQRAWCDPGAILATTSE